MKSRRFPPPDGANGNSNINGKGNGKRHNAREHKKLKDFLYRERRRNRQADKESRVHSLIRLPIRITGSGKKSPNQAA